MITFCIPSTQLLKDLSEPSHSYILSSTFIKTSVISTLTMAPTEMVQYHPPMSRTVSSRPPDIPGLLPIVTLNDEQAVVANGIAAMKMAPTILSSYLPSSENPLETPPPSPTAPCSPTPCQTCSKKSPSQVAMEFAQQLTEALKSTNTKQGPPPPPAKPSGEFGEPKAQASRLELKTVNEVYVFNITQVHTC
jgi:hypothetical protein